jgi:maleate isomerase
VTGDRLTVGVVTPHQAPGPEVELPAMTRGRIATLVSRTPWPPTLDLSGVTFEDASIIAVAHASTTSGYVLGHREETTLADRLAQRFGVPGVAGGAAAVQALRTHAVERVQLVHPLWFDDELDGLGVAYFRSQGIDAVVTRATGLPDDPARVEPRQTVDWVGRHVEDGVGAVFLAGNGFRAAAAVEELERRTGLLVVAANQALLWGILAATGTACDVRGHGRLLRTVTSST